MSATDHPLRRAPSLREVGSVCLLIPATLILYSCRGEDDPKASCRDHLKALAIATLMYADTYDDRFPTSNWFAELLPNVGAPDYLRCTVKQVGGYAMNSEILGSRRSEADDLEGGRMLFFDCGDKPNLAAPFGKIDLGRHPWGGNAVLTNFTVLTISKPPPR